MSAAHISETIREKYPHVATDRYGVAYPDLEHGIPVDRTICPRCLGLEHQRQACHVCKGGPVCPGCRNARVVSMPGAGIRYAVCPECCDPQTDEHGRVVTFETGLPRWYWYPQRQQEAIRGYRLKRWQDRDAEAASIDDIPFD
jgi:hypothetical protein